MITGEKIFPAVSRTHISTVPALSDVVVEFVAKANVSTAYSDGT